MISIRNVNLPVDNKEYINVKIEYDKDYKLDFLISEEKARELKEKLEKHLEK